MLTVFALKIA